MVLRLMARHNASAAASPAFIQPSTARVSFDPGPDCMFQLASTSRAVDKRATRSPRLPSAAYGSRHGVERGWWPEYGPALDGVTRSASELEPCLTWAGLPRPSLPQTERCRAIRAHGCSRSGTASPACGRAPAMALWGARGSCLRVSPSHRIHQSVTTPPPK